MRLRDQRAYAKRVARWNGLALVVMSPLLLLIDDVGSWSSFDPIGIKLRPDTFTATHHLDMLFICHSARSNRFGDSMCFA